MAVVALAVAVVVVEEEEGCCVEVDGQGRRNAPRGGVGRKRERSEGQKRHRTLTVPMWGCMLSVPLVIASYGAMRPSAARRSRECRSRERREGRHAGTDGGEGSEMKERWGRLSERGR